MSFPIEHSSLEASHPLKKRRRRIFTYFWVCTFILLLLGLIYYQIFWKNIVYTDDAYVEGNQVYITPLHAGFVTAIHTDDSYLVNKGQVLVELDTTDYRIALASSQEKLAQRVRQVCQMFHRAFAYRAEIEVKRAETIQAIQDFEHRQRVLSEGAVSTEDFEHSIASLRSTFFSLRMTKSQFDEAVSMIQDTSIKSHPLVLEAIDHLREAWVELHRCKIYAPVEGLTSQRTIQVGMWVKAGDPLMNVIPMDQIWVNANYKETQLKHVRIGQEVELTADLYGRTIKYHGKIAGLPGAAGNTLSLLPPQNLSGNWIKIVQRLPVRVELDPNELKKFPLRLGLSMKSYADIHDKSGLLLPISSQGSPLYQTSIFENEEEGNLSFIDQIIMQNMDPSLNEYLDAAIIFPKLKIALPAIAEEAFLEDDDFSLIFPSNNP